jgi:hypothetical protein
MRFAIVVALLLALVAPISSAQQTSNTLPFTAVTPPAAPVLTSLTGLSSTGKIYAGSKMPIIGTGFASNCNVNVDGAVQPASSVTFVSSTEIDFTIPSSEGSTTGVSHTASVSCPVTVLTMKATSPITLPNGKVGTTYSANLPQLSSLTGGVSPYAFSLATGSLPIGMTLSSSGILGGTPSGTGSFSFTVLVLDSSGLANKRGDDAQKDSWLTSSGASRSRRLFSNL